MSPVTTWFVGDNTAIVSLGPCPACDKEVWDTGMHLCEPPQKKAKRVTSFRLSDETIRGIDRLASVIGCSRSEVIVQAVLFFKAEQAERIRMFGSPLRKK